MSLSGCFGVFMDCAEILGSSRKIKILVVDDDPDYHLLIEDVLDETRLPYELTCLATVPAAMESIDSGATYDVVLVDYMIRPNTGFDLFTFIKNRNLRIPCIVLTNYDSPQLDQEAVRAGVSDLIAKQDIKAGILKRSILYAIRDNHQKAQLEYLAHYDPLTGLINRSLFFDRLDTACRYADREDRFQYSVLYIDLDYFKTINDTYGHAIGDQVLKVFAKKLKAELRESDTAARLSGDEFAVLLHNANPPVAHMIAQKILQAMERPAVIEGHKIQISISVGIATTQVSGTDAKTLMNDADCALYAAKRSGRKTYYHFNKDRSSEIYNQITLEKDLKQAISEKQFELYYQPQFLVTDLKLIGFETLIRWRHPEKGVIEPGAFLDGLHRLGCDKAFTDLILDMFFQGVSEIKNKLGNIKVAINMIPHQCLEPGFIDTIKTFLLQYQVSPANICIEITEHRLMTQLSRLLEPLEKLRELGVQVALDDFGEKYSSLNVLADLPVNLIKIDKYIVQKAADDPKVVCILKAITDIAKSLDLITIAEGIENSTHYALIQKLGCHAFQGYWKSDPIPFERVSAEYFPALTE